MPKRPDKLTEKQAMFVAELATNGGNASKAAEAVGFNPQHGRRLVSTNSAVQAALTQTRAAQQNVLRDWGELAQRAQDKLEHLMLHGEDERVQLMATIHVLERHLGKTVTKSEAVVDVKNSAIDEGTMTAIMALMAHHQWNLATAYQYVVSNPVEVKAWLKALPKPRDSATIEEASYELVERGPGRESEADYEVEEADDLPSSAPSD